MTTQIDIPAGSIEFLKASITSDVELNAQTVQISIDGKATWLPAVWVGTVGTTRTARTSSVVTWSTRGSFFVFAKIGDNPESPIVKCGRVDVK